ncbi:hypothetical protein [Actinoplanes derwentensis]|uniref:BMP family ABC transporter substrate-binding protein n=1 Tax=Actinoplanes derwentensis TaxID=113562 RepID=A0A1H1SRQ5_9ACTN|nr:hypothetical protein [Actinoplanes derwentensis]GID83226.1 hypothetical protein Ade03nite_21500 [Actinoplanes derwentensis]SDS50690.1 hypothetical protein SAMN04489716_0935 [Actinoplanes derwentensis]
MRRLLRAVVLFTATAVLVSACADHDDWSRSRPAPAPLGALGTGFTDPSAPPTPEAIITPSPGSWSSVRPPAGYRVVLLTIGTDAPAEALVTAVHDWASAEDVSLRTVTADATKPVDAIVEAMALRPDLIVSAGNGLIDPLALVSPSHLDQQFLIVGAEIAEPTANVTAVDWTGASFRGAGLGAASAFDPATFTEARCAAAIRAGAAAVLHDVTGVVLWLDRY